MIEEEQAVEQPVVVHDEPSPEPGDDRRGSRIETPFDQGFVDALKERWPHGTRRWSEAEEVWWLASGNEKAVEELVLEHFDGCRVIHPDGSETLRDQSGDYEQGGLFT